jgi:arylsulfatase A-like enzyme
VVFIMADDLGAHDLGCYGRSDYRTPAIDRLAAEGLGFDQTYANSPTYSLTRPWSSTAATRTCPEVS